MDKLSAIERERLDFAQRISQLTGQHASVVVEVNLQLKRSGAPLVARAVAEGARMQPLPNAFMAHWGWKNGQTSLYTTRDSKCDCCHQTIRGKG